MQFSLSHIFAWSIEQLVSKLRERSPWDKYNSFQFLWSRGWTICASSSIYILSRRRGSWTENQEGCICKAPFPPGYISSLHLLHIPCMGTWAKQSLWSLVEPCEVAYDVSNQWPNEDMTQHLLKIRDQQDFGPIISINQMALITSVNHQRVEKGKILEIRATQSNTTKLKELPLSSFRSTTWVLGTGLHMQVSYF